MLAGCWAAESQEPHQDQTPMGYVADVTGKPGRIRSDPTGEPTETKSNQTEVQILLGRPTDCMEWAGEVKVNKNQTYSTR